MNFTNKIIFTLTILFLSLLSACANGPDFQNTENSSPTTDALIYIYRPKTLALSGYLPKTYLNSKQIGSLKIGGYFATQIPAGKVRILMDGGLFFRNTIGMVSGSFEVELGETVYIKLEPTAKSNGLGTEYSVKLLKVSELLGQEEIKLLKESN